MSSAEDPLSAAAATMLTAAEVAPMLRVSVRKVYELAGAKLPCYRIEGSVRFTEKDVMEYREKCRSTATKRIVAGALNLTASFQVKGESALASVFRKHGIVPKQKPSTAKKPTDSIPSQQASRDLKLVSKTQ